MTSGTAFQRNSAFALVSVLVVLTVSFSSARAETDNMRQGVSSRYGPEGDARVQRWRDLIVEARGLSEADQLERVNHFFNQLNAQSDLAHWGSRDYWATPIELLGSNAGDCEDFSIAKYVTLIELGIPDDRMRITYARFLPHNQAHMVLAYYATPESDPLVLDNVDPIIRTVSRRSDLDLVFSFNGDGLWSREPVGKERRVGDASGLEPWRTLRTRLAMSEVAVR